jgi:hypothetical protein
MLIKEYTELMKFIGWLLLIVIIGVGTWAIVYKNDTAVLPPTPTDESPEQGMARQEIRGQVVAFGYKLKNVSLLSPTAASDMQREYSMYVTRSLLASWAGRPESALGRTTSSPWPEHIDVIEIVQNGEVYEVRAMLVYMTSVEVQKGGDAGTSELLMIVKQEDNIWKIDSVTVIRQNNPNTPRSESDKPKLE